MVRLLASEYADRGVLLESLAFLGRELDELAQALSAAEQREAALPRRSGALAINRRPAFRVLDARRAWITEVRELA